MSNSTLRKAARWVTRKAKKSRPFEKDVDGPERLLPFASAFKSAAFRF